VLRRVLRSPLVVLPVSAVAIGTASHTLAQLADPCVTWGVGDSGIGYIRPHDLCGVHTGMGETRTEAGLMLAGIQGGMLLAAVLGVWGAARPRPKIMLLGGILMTLEMIPSVFSICPLAVLTGSVLIYPGLRNQRAARHYGGPEPGI